MSASVVYNAILLMAYVYDNQDVAMIKRFSGMNCEWKSRRRNLLGALSCTCKCKCRESGLCQAVSMIMQTAAM